MCLQLVSDFKPNASLAADIDRKTSQYIYALEKCYSPDPTTVHTGLDYFDKVLIFAQHPTAKDESIGDVLVWGAIRGNPEALSAVMAGKYPNVKLWYEERACKLVCVHQAEGWYKKDSKYVRTLFSVSDCVESQA